MLRCAFETNSLNCWERLRHAGADAGDPCSRGPVQLLCRALRVAPACYRRLELVPAQPNEPLLLCSGLISEDEEEWIRGNQSSFCAVAGGRCSARRTPGVLSHVGHRV